MELVARVAGSVRAALDVASGRAARAASVAMRQGADGLTAELRGQVTGSGLGPRLARTWRNAVYPKGRDSLGAAALVYSRAPDIVRAFDEGAVIRAKSGFWLTIPTAAVPRGPGGRRLTAGDVERRFGQPLRFVYRRGKPALLVLDNARVGKSGRARANRGSRGGAEFTRLRGRTTIVMFILVPQVHLRKRLDVVPAGARWGAEVAELFARELSRES